MLEGDVLRRGGLFCDARTGLLEERKVEAFHEHSMLAVSAQVLALFIYLSSSRVESIGRASGYGCCEKTRDTYSFAVLILCVPSLEFLS